ncbi:hypothetical protein ACFRIC_41325 [Streptomyces sp. NPDC056738]|uniref:hypothetical protein n=1 Tax=Streptomyces sp. NPDC056738 TaxID=3345933 RepID=UPI003690945D
MNVQRVMEVWDPVGQIAGTGYLITDRLVLTAYHNVQGAGSTSPRAVELRRLALYGEKQAGWVAAEVLWPKQPPDMQPVNAVTGDDARVFGDSTNGPSDRVVNGV